MTLIETINPEESTDMVVPVRASALAAPVAGPMTSNPAGAVPSIEHILMTAIERGIDPANLEKLVALHERVNAQRAEQAFVQSVTSFRAQCPALVKNRTAKDGGGKSMYRYLDLSELTILIDPVLTRHALTYSWDTDFQADRFIVTCTVRHAAGHSLSSKFIARENKGTSMMSSAQVAATNLTFGRRHSLISVLGLTVDDDNDARRAPAMPQPASDPNAPLVKPRAERSAEDQRPEEDDAAPKVTADTLNALVGEWQRNQKPPGGTTQKFREWARSVLRTDAELDRVSEWTIDAVSSCEEALR